MEKKMTEKKIVPQDQDIFNRGFCQHYISLFMEMSKAIKNALIVVL